MFFSSPNKTEKAGSRTRQAIRSFSLRAILKQSISAFGLQAALVLATIGLICVVVSNSETLNSALAINGDEGFEVTKAALWMNGFQLYDQVWNNQPPLHTVLLGLCFRFFGCTIGVSRGLAMCFGLLLVAGCFVLIKQRFGMIAAYATAASLLTAPEVLKLSLAAMLEAPALGVAVWSFWPVERWDKGRHWTALFTSACSFALALQIKLTAAIVAPALILDLALHSRGPSWSQSARNALTAGAIWAGSVIIVFFTLSLVLGGNYDQMWSSLFSSETAAYLRTVRDFTFAPRLLWEHTEGFWGAIVGLTVWTLKRDWRGGAFLAVFMASVTIIHLTHRPYWHYYYLHFAVPMALLTGYGFGELVRFARTRGLSGFQRFPFPGLASSMAAAFILWLLASEGFTRFASEIEQIASQPRVTNSLVVAKMRDYRSRTKWVYSRDYICTFHAKVLLIPELAVIPDNRLWSKRITQSEIWEIVKKYDPEQLLLKEELGPETQSFVDANYVLVFEDTEHKLYVAKRLTLPP